MSLHMLWIQIFLSPKLGAIQGERMAEDGFMLFSSALAQRERNRMNPEFELGSSILLPDQR